MPYSSEHRFKRQHGIHYNTKLNVPWVSEISGIPKELLQEVFDDAYKITPYTPTAMMAVYSYCIGGKEYKRRHIGQNISSENTNVSDGCFSDVCR